MTIRFQIPVYLSDRVSASFDSKKNWYMLRMSSNTESSFIFAEKNSKTQKTGKKIKKTNKQKRDAKVNWSLKMSLDT